MSGIIPVLDWVGHWENVRIEHDRYWDGSREVRLVLEDGELLTTASICLSDYGAPPGEGCFWVKSYSEGTGLADRLSEVGVVAKTGNAIQFGPFNVLAEEVRFTPEYESDWPREAVVEV